MKPYHQTSLTQDMDLKLNIFSYITGEYNQHFHPHWHREVEVLMVLRGQFTVQVNERIFTVCQGEVAVIGSNDVHSTHANSNMENEILVLHFNTDFLETSFSLSEKSLITLFRDHLEFPGPIRPENAGYQELVEQMHSIRNEWKEKSPAYEILIKAYLLTMIGKLVRYYGKDRKKGSGDSEMIKAKEMLLNTFEFIDKNYMEEVTLEQAAKVSNLSVSHFCRLFKLAAGMTFYNYLSFYRVNKAEGSLTSGKTMMRIAHESGFGNVVGLIRAFKKFKHTTPAQYRDKLLKKTDLEDLT